MTFESLEVRSGCPASGVGDVGLTASFWAAVREACPSRSRLFLNGRLENEQRVGEVVESLESAEELAALGSESSLLYIKDIHKASPRLVVQLACFYGYELLDEGIGIGHVKADAFVGEYRATQGGIHREQCSNRHLVLGGRKIFYAWDSRLDPYVEGHIREVSTSGGVENYLTVHGLDELKDLAILADVGRRNYVHIPAWVWHIAEAPVPCASVNIASYGARDSKIRVARSGEGEVGASVVRALVETLGARDCGGPRPALAVASAGGLKTSKIQIAKVGHVAGGGTLRKLARPPVLWTALDDELVVAIGGQATVLPREAAGMICWFGDSTTTEYIVRSEPEISLARWLVGLGVAEVGDASLE